MKSAALSVPERESQVVMRRSWPASKFPPVEPSELPAHQHHIPSVAKSSRFALPASARETEEVLTVLSRPDQVTVASITAQGAADFSCWLVIHWSAVTGSEPELERGIILERVKAGVAQAQRAGKHCGRPKKVFRRDEAAPMRKRGMSWRAVSKALNVPAATIRLPLLWCAESLPPRPPKP